MSIQGRIIKWDDEKGFGFIKVPDNAENIFVHASSFVDKRLRPAVGDEVTFEVKQSQRGLEAKKVCYPNQPSQLLTTSNLPGNHRNNTRASSSISSFLLKLIILVGLIIGSYYFYTQYQQKIRPTDYTKPVYAESTSNTSTLNSSSNFKCDGRQHCSQMNSLEEAEFFIKNCPNTKMDGDNDGEPCENDSRW
jgi:cold shock CspA family protein